MRAKLCALFAALVPAAVAVAGAPDIDSAVVFSRVFNDSPASTFSSTVNYPSLVSLMDQNVDNGFANLHTWRLSDDAGSTAAKFMNNGKFSIFADVTIDGSGEGEGGLNLSPWWSPLVDGRFNVRTTDGEIAIFGGRLPFYSFTNSQGLTYTKGSTVRLGIIYNPNSLTMADPATVRYIYDDGTNVYTSGPLAFDEGNPAEDPPYGLWGMLNDARVGGYMQVLAGTGTPSTDLTATFENIAYIPAPGSAALALLGLGAAIRRRR